MVIAKNLPQQSVDKIIDMHINQSLPVYKIAKEFDCSFATICKVLVLNGYEQRPRSETDERCRHITKEIEVAIVNYYSECKIKKLVRTKFNLTTGGLNRILETHQLNFSSKHPNNASGIEDEIITDYLQGLSQEKLIGKYKIGYSTLIKILGNNKIENRVFLKYSIDEDYFKEINSFLKTFFVGLLLADGCVSKNRRSDKSLSSVSISLQERDGYLLERFKQDIKTERILTLVDKGPGRQKQVKFYFNNKRIAKDLEDLDFHASKSFDASIPIDRIPVNLLRFLILGIFDGDGSVGECEGNWKNGEKFYHQFKQCCRIHGSEKTINQIKEIFDKLDIVSNIGFKQCKNGKIFHIKVSSKEGMLKVYNYFYKDAEFCLLRKKHKFETILDRLYGDEYEKYPDHTFPNQHQAVEPKKRVPKEKI